METSYRGEHIEYKEKQDLWVCRGLGLEADSLKSLKGKITRLQKKSDPLVGKKILFAPSHSWDDFELKEGIIQRAKFGSYVEVETLNENVDPPFAYTVNVYGDVFEYSEAAVLLGNEIQEKFKQASQLREKAEALKEELVDVRIPGKN